MSPLTSRSTGDRPSFPFSGRYLRRTSSQCQRSSCGVTRNVAQLQTYRHVTLPGAFGLGRAAGTPGPPRRDTRLARLNAVSGSEAPTCSIGGCPGALSARCHDAVSEPRRDADNDRNALDRTLQRPPRQRDICCRRCSSGVGAARAAKSTPRGRLGPARAAWPVTGRRMTASACPRYEDLGVLGCCPWVSCEAGSPTTIGDSVSAAPTPPGAAVKPPAIRRRKAARQAA